MEVEASLSYMVPHMKSMRHDVVSYVVGMLRSPEMTLCDVIALRCI